MNKNEVITKVALGELSVEEAERLLNEMKGNSAKSFWEWIKGGDFGSPANHAAAHMKLGTMQTKSVGVRPQIWQTLFNMHYVAERDPYFPDARSREDYAGYFIRAFTDSSAATCHGVKTISVQDADDAFKLLYQRYLVECSVGRDAASAVNCRANRRMKRDRVKLSQALDVSLWVVSAIIGFCFVPYADVLSGYGRFDPPDLAKPLLFGAFATVIIRWIAGYVFGERFFD